MNVIKLRKAFACLALGALFALGQVPTASADESDPNLQQTVTDQEGTAAPGTKVEITHGHVDMGPRLIDGNWVLMARDDTADQPTWRALDDIVFVLDKPSLQTLPEGDEYDFVGGKSGESVWAIPQNEVPSVPWLGWNTQSPAVIQNVNGQVKLTFEGHQGEGQFTTFLQAGNFGEPQQLWTSTQSQAQPINVDLNTHTHVNWVFTKPGVHLVKITASATLKDGKAVTASGVLRFAIGDGSNPPDVAAAQTAKWEGGAGIQAAASPSDTPQQSASLSNRTLMLIGGAIAVVAVAVVILAALASRRKRKLRQAALEQLNESA